MRCVAIIALALPGCGVLSGPSSAADALRSHCEDIEQPAARVACLAAVDTAERYCHHAEQQRSTPDAAR